MTTHEARTARHVALIGAPTDIGAGHCGSNMGPDALRIAGIAPALAQLGLRVLDRGNLQGPANPQLAAVNGLRHLNAVVAWNEMVHAAVYAELRSGHFPILLGGDHCLGIGSVSAVARHCRETGKKLLVVWLDAHADFNTSSVSPSGNIHGMPVACLCGHGPEALCRIGGTIPALSASSLRLIGLRSVDRDEGRLIREAGVPTFDMRRIDEVGMRAVIETALREIGEETHLHVSFDVDFLDPSIAPGVGTTVLGGPSYREAQLCMEMIADTGALGSLDIVELNPALDVRNGTATVAVEMVQSLFGKSTLHRGRERYAVARQDPVTAVGTV